MRFVLKVVVRRTMVLAVAGAVLVVMIARTFGNGGCSGRRNCRVLVMMATEVVELKETSTATA